MNKRGDVKSIIVMIAIVIALAFAAIIFAKVFLMVTAEIETIPEFDNQTIAIIAGVEAKTIPLLDFFVFFSLISLMIGLIISSIFMDIHPAVTIILVVVLIVAIFMAGVFSNIFYEVTHEPELVSTAEQFKMTNLILGEHFPTIILVIGTIIIIIVYAKSKGQASVPV